MKPTKCLAGNIDLEERDCYNAEQMCLYMDRVHALAEVLRIAIGHAACDLAAKQYGNFDDRYEENLQTADSMDMRLRTAEWLLDNPSITFKETK